MYGHVPILKTVGCCPFLLTDGTIFSNSAYQNCYFDIFHGVWFHPIRNSGFRGGPGRGMPEEHPSPGYCPKTGMTCGFKP